MTAPASTTLQSATPSISYSIPAHEMATTVSRSSFTTYDSLSTTAQQLGPFANSLSRGDYSHEPSTSNLNPVVAAAKKLDHFCADMTVLRKWNATLSSLLNRLDRNRFSNDTINTLSRLNPNILEACKRLFTENIKDRQDLTTHRDRISALSSTFKTSMDRTVLPAWRNVLSQNQAVPSKTPSNSQKNPHREPYEAKGNTAFSIAIGGDDTTDPAKLLEPGDIVAPAIEETLDQFVTTRITQSNQYDIRVQPPEAHINPACEYVFMMVHRLYEANVDSFREIADVAATTSTNLETAITSCLQIGNKTETQFKAEGASLTAALADFKKTGKLIWSHLLTLRKLERYFQESEKFLTLKDISDYDKETLQILQSNLWNQIQSGLNREAQQLGEVTTYLKAISQIRTSLERSFDECDERFHAFRYHVRNLCQGKPPQHTDKQLYNLGRYAHNSFLGMVPGVSSVLSGRTNSSMLDLEPGETLEPSPLQGFNADRFVESEQLDALLGELIRRTEGVCRPSPSPSNANLSADFQNLTLTASVAGDRKTRDGDSPTNRTPASPTTTNGNPSVAGTDHWGDSTLNTTLAPASISSSSSTISSSASSSSSSISATSSSSSSSSSAPAPAASAAPAPAATTKTKVPKEKKNT